MTANTSTKTTSQYTRKKIEQFSYGLNDVIGKGYSSQVYKGRHDDSQQPVAVKVIDMKLLKNEINRTLLESEIEILKELKQVPNILTLHEVYTTKNNTYIITQLCSSDLNKRIKDKMSQDQVFYYMDQIIQGYLQVYQKQIVHRDLKPANILISQKDQCKIADFGFAIKASELLKPSKYNVGSPLYMAPQSLRKNQYSYKTDLWSVGVIFFEMLTGQTPWKAKTEKDLLKKIQTERIDNVIEKRKLNFSSLTVDFLNKCLCIQKHKRLQPYELKHFVFKPCISNILSESKPNNMLGTKTGISLLNTSLTSPKNQLFSKFTFPQKSTLLKNTQNNSYQTILKQQPSIKPQLKRQLIKTISKQLISQIHFCRYLFKLIGRIKESQQKFMLKQYRFQTDQILNKYSAIIKHKIQKLIHFQNTNFLQFDHNTYTDYKQTSDFKKILKISKQYKDRYKTQLGDNWKTHNYSDRKLFSTEQTVVLMRRIIQTFQSQQSKISKQISRYEKDVIVLDYLITAKQLLEMLSQGENYQKFSRKSKIQQIVEGTTTTITFQLYQKILERGKQLTSFSIPYSNFNTREIPLKV